MNALIANFGNDSIALIMQAYRDRLQNVRVISVETGFANPLWDERVRQAEAWVKSLEFSSVRLTAKPDFRGLMKAQGEFPSPKFQWCATYLKGETIRKYLAEVDPLKEGKILVARAYTHDHLADSEDFDQRPIYYPLYDATEKILQDLVAQSPLPWLPHRSLECDPCVNSNAVDAQRALASGAVKERLAALEAEIGEAFLDSSRPPQRQGCGSSYGCGL